MVWVLNTGDERLQDRWDGQLYEYPPNVPVEIPEHVAEHTFGFVSGDKERCLIRLGWVQTANDLVVAFERLSKFVLSTERPEIHHYPSPVVGRVPLPRKRGEGKGTLEVA